MRCVGTKRPPRCCHCKARLRGLAELSDCDWVIETISEQLHAKQALFAELESIVVHLAFLVLVNWYECFVNFTKSRLHTNYQKYSTLHQSHRPSPSSRGC